MPYYLVHANTSLQKVTTAGVVSTVTLPSGVTMVNTRRARFAMIAGIVVGVNAFSRNVAITASTVVARLLNITGPTGAPTSASGAAGNITGTFRYAFSYVVKSGTTVLTESPLSSLSTPLTVNAKQIDLSSISTSSNTDVTHRFIYRTTNNGADLFKAGEIANNTATTYNDNLSDYDLGLLPVAENKGNPPGSDDTDYFRVIAAWKDRLFASPNVNLHRVHRSGNREPYSWGAEDYFVIGNDSEDAYGVTAFMARRDELVIAKRRQLWKLIGDTPDNYQLIKVADGIGAVSQEAALVVGDTCYFLGEDGFYEYGPAGVKSITRDTVHPWFTSDTYFNRSYFHNAFAKANQAYDTIELHLPAAGSSNIDRWVSYDRRQRMWTGPHKTSAFTPTAAGAMDDADGFSTPVMGSSAGYLYRQNQSTISDDGTAIEMDVVSKWHNGNTPDILKFWGQPAVVFKLESAGTLSVIPKVGDLDATAQDTMSVDLTDDGRVRLPRLGTGRFCQLRLYNNENNQGVTVYGYEIPFHEVGRR